MGRRYLEFSWGGLIYDGPHGTGWTRVHTILVHEDNLFVGGFFTKAGETEVNNIARWNINEQTWHTLGQGTDITVRTLAFHGDYLYIGGNFKNSGGQDKNIRMWDGNNWHSLAADPNGSIFVIEKYKNKLYIGGHFTSFAGKAANRVLRRFDGRLWTVSLSYFPDHLDITLEGADDFHLGTHVDISAHYNKGYRFKEWTGHPDDLALLDNPSSPATFLNIPGRNLSFNGKLCDRC